MSFLPFSQRYGYAPINDAFVRETITEDIENAIYNCYYSFEKSLKDNRLTGTYVSMEEFLWRFFLNNLVINFRDGYGGHAIVLTSFIIDTDNAWYRKLDIIEYSLKYLYAITEKHDSFTRYCDRLVDDLNNEFERLNYAYRVVNTQIVEVTAKEEIAAIQTALEENKDNVREHLTKALELCSKRPVGDYRNSIKESISAVEAICRTKTGENTLGKALNKLEKKV